ncbi:MAG: hypothetical protein OET87_01335, partial [Desulfobulbaceae bacterium]|nr:hypothetical protein [Desulfobulbaceae bacterium]
MDFPRSEKKWLLRQLPTDITETQVKKIARDAGIPETIVTLLIHRGVSDKRNIKDFLNPSLHELPRPHLMKGMNEAVSILLG